jgi:glutamate/tyrosine decarboxylase-like PLP-dependent enzyme
LSQNSKTVQPAEQDDDHAGGNLVVHRGSLDLDADEMRLLGNTVTNLLVDHLTSLRSQPAIAKHASVTDPVLPLGAAPEEGTTFERILGTLRERVLPFHAREPHPGFMAYVPSCPTFPAMVGDWIATGFNFYAGVWPVATGPNRVEVVVLEWFRNWLRMPAGCGGLLTTGGSAANFTAIVAARHRATGGDAGLIPKLVMYTSEQAHSSVSRAGWLAGIARSQVRSVPVDAERRIMMTALAEMIAADRGAGLIPFAVVASAGTTNTGAIDPMHAVADLCSEAGAWMHVDGAYGGFAVLTDWGRQALAGMERADSITLDPHKCLYVPFECGCLMFRDPAQFYDAYGIFPDYLKDVRSSGAAGSGGTGDGGAVNLSPPVPGGQPINFADYGEQLTRYNRALKVWVSVNYFGLATLRQAMERTFALAKLAEKLVLEHAELEVLSPAQMGIFCFRARPGGMGDGPELDALNEHILTNVNESGKFFISSTRLDGRYSLRICVLGFRTSEADIETFVRDVVRYSKD